MIIIVDDTSNSKFDFLNENKYVQRCTLFKIVNLKELEEKINDCELFCIHRSIDNRVEAINLFKVNKKNIPIIVFTDGQDTNIETNTIRKNLFYSNLKNFLDYYLENQIVETKILYFGVNYKVRDKFTKIQNMFVEIRMNSEDSFINNSSIKEGLSLLYPGISTEEIIESWLKLQLSQSAIIKEINNQIRLSR